VQIEKSEDELAKIETQYSALEMILQQYENFSMDSRPYNALQLQMLQSFLDTCFESFVANVDCSNYSAFTRTLLLWVERLDFQRPAEAMLAPIFKNEQ